MGRVAHQQMCLPGIGPAPASSLGSHLRGSEHTVTGTDEPISLTPVGLPSKCLVDIAVTWVYHTDRNPLPSHFEREAEVRVIGYDHSCLNLPVKNVLQ